MKAKSYSKYVALMGMLLGVTIVLSIVENALTPTLPMGIKLGASNIVIMFALLQLDSKSAFSLVVLKSVFVFLTRGLIASGMSLAGGLFSTLIMLVLLKNVKPSMLLISVSGAVSHNISQLLFSAIITQSRYTLMYFPILLVSGIIAGVCTGIVLRAVLPYLYKTNLT